MNQQLQKAVDRLREKIGKMSMDSWIREYSDEELAVLAVEYLNSHADEVFPKMMRVWHITTNGTNRLCGVKDIEEPAIHITYANRVLDEGVWCNACQTIMHHEFKLQERQHG